VPPESRAFRFTGIAGRIHRQFLVDLRARFGGRSYFAGVEGEEIKYGEQAMSPSRFANLQGSGNRNAWKAIWICLPGSDEWLLADVCRSARKGAIARLPGDDAPAAQSPQEPKRPTTILRRSSGSRPAAPTELAGAGTARSIRLIRNSEKPADAA